VHLLPWEYLTTPFRPQFFPDLFTPTWVAAIVLLVVLVVLYNVRGRALHRHPPYLDLWEWMLWTGLSTLQKLAKQRYISRTRFSRPEATIRQRPTRRSRRRR
jgi:hypothetical protein